VKGVGTILLRLFLFVFLFDTFYLCCLLGALLVISSGLARADGRGSHNGPLADSRWETVCVSRHSLNGQERRGGGKRPF